MRNCTALILGVVLISAGCAKPGSLDMETVYDSNPNHLWNRLNKTLFERTAPDGKHYGLDQLDILYWGRTTNLLSGASHQQALAVLDEFNNEHGEKLIHDPLKKALLQRDLWALFDWVAVPMPFYQAQFPNERHELASRLAIAIHRLALTTNEIAALPDNYALAVKNYLPDLPAGLFSTNGIWVNVSADNVERIVPTHTLSFGGRSVFSVWFCDLDGHQAGLDYLKQLSVIKPMWVQSHRESPSDTMELNPDFPQFPTNTQWALARRMCVIDTDGRIQPTRVVESIQLRAYLGFGEPEVVMVTNQNGSVVPLGIPPQRFNEFQMTRDAQANLISLGQEQRDFTFVHFMSKGIDAFENYPKDDSFDIKRVQARVLRTCIECHSGPGISSVNSFTRFLSFSYPPSGETTHLMPSPPGREDEETIGWKEQSFSWGLLQGLWMRND